MAKDLRAILVVPASNTTMAEEFPGYCPEIADIRVARVPRPPRLLTGEDLPQYRRDTLASVDPFRAEGADVVVFGCTLAGFMSGREGDAAIAAALADRVGAPCVTTASGMVQALAHSGVGRVTVVTPYMAAVNDALVRFVEADGIAVDALDSFFLPTVEEFAAVPAGAIHDKAVAAFGPASEGVFVACTQLRTREALPRLRATLGRPVWGAVQASAWMAMRALDLPHQRLAA